MSLSMTVTMQSMTLLAACEGQAITVTDLLTHFKGGIDQYSSPEEISSLLSNVRSGLDLAKQVRLDEGWTKVQHARLAYSLAELKRQFQSLETTDPVATGEQIDLLREEAGAIIDVLSGKNRKDSVKLTDVDWEKTARDYEQIAYETVLQGENVPLLHGFGPLSLGFGSRLALNRDSALWFSSLDGRPLKYSALAYVGDDASDLVKELNKDHRGPLKMDPEEAWVHHDVIGIEPGKRDAQHQVSKLQVIGISSENFVAAMRADNYAFWRKLPENAILLSPIELRVLPEGYHEISADYRRDHHERKDGTKSISVEGKVSSMEGLYDMIRYITGRNDVKTVHMSDESSDKDLHLYPDKKPSPVEFVFASNDMEAAEYVARQFRRPGQVDVRIIDDVKKVWTVDLEKERATVFNLKVLRDYAKSMIEDRNMKDTLLKEAVALLSKHYWDREETAKRTAQYISEALDTDPPDEDQLSGVAENIINNKEIFGRIIPFIVHNYLWDHGSRSLDNVIAPGPYPYPYFNPQVLREAERQEDPMTGYTPPWSHLFRAVDRQAQRWMEVERTVGDIPLEKGILATGGQFDSLMNLLWQQAMFDRRREEDFLRIDPPLSTVVTTMPNTETMPKRSDVLALRHTAGIHETGKLQIGKYPVPFDVVAYPAPNEAYLRTRFKFQSFTPRADRLEAAFTKEVVRSLPKGALIGNATKGISPNGREVGEWMEKVLMNAGRLQKDEKGEDIRRDVDFGFFDGFTGAESVFANNPPMDHDHRARAFHLGFGCTNLEAGIELATFLTGVPVDKAKIVEIGGTKVFSFRAWGLRRPLIMTVYADRDLCRAQRLYAIYKNVYSGILGKEIFEYVWKALNRSDGEIKKAMVIEAEKYYEDLIKKAQKGMLDILEKVEGIPKEKLHILPPALQDAVESWRVKEGGVDKLFQLIQKIFYAPYEGCPSEDCEANKDILGRNIKIWQEDIGKVFATRNPQAGVSLAAGRLAVKLKIPVKDSSELMPKKWFEGLNTAFILGDQRLSAHQLTVLNRDVPQVAEYITDAQQIFAPTGIEPEVWNDMMDVSDYLEYVCTNRFPTDEQLKTILKTRVPIHVLPSDDLEKELDALRSQAKTFDLPHFDMVVDAIVSHMSRAKGLIFDVGEQHARLSEETLRYIDAIISHMNEMKELAMDIDEGFGLKSDHVHKLLSALRWYINEGTRLHIKDEDLESVRKDLDYRTSLMKLYLNDIRKPVDEREHRFPYPRGYVGIEKRDSIPQDQE